MAIGPLWMVNITLAGLNAALVAGLLSIYVKNFGQIKSKFTIGLLIFAGLFLLQNLAAIVIFMDFATEYTAQVAIPLILINILQTGSFGALLWATLRS